MAGDARIELFGGLRIRIDGRDVGEADWAARRARELVALLALTPGRRLPRDRVVELLWPHLDAEAGTRNLRKAAHHARRALGEPEAVTLKGGSVELLPGARVTTDLEAFLAAADAALRNGAPGACAEVAGTAGELLPEAPYESWTQDPRRQVHDRRAALLRRAGAHEALLELEPTDEEACAGLMAEALAAGRRHVAIRWYERLRLALARELGTVPGPEVSELYERCTAGVRAGARLFVGRELELAQLAGELQRLAGGGTGVAVVRGPTGIGKSALCREAVVRAAETGWRALGVSCVASGPPYGPVAALVEQLLPGAALAVLPERTRSVLAEFAPLPGGAAPLPGVLTRHQVIAALRRLLAASGTAPVLLVVEDAHLADEAGADVLHQLVAGSASGPPLLVVLALRSEWMRTSLPSGVRELLRAEGAVTLTLGPLEDDAVATLVAQAAAVAPADVERITAAAEGSPFFALELAQALAEGASGALPRTVREAIRERFAALDAPTLDGLAVLAVAEDDLDLASVLALTGRPEAEAFALLDAVLEAGALVVAGARYRFRHGLVRQALVDDLAPHRRLQLHREAAARLQASGARPGLVAHHWLVGERPAEAAPFLLEAARRASALGAYADALAELDRLLVVAPADEESLCLRAEVLDALGDGRAPAAYATAALAVGPPEDQELLARQALAELKASDPAGALRTLEGVAPRSVVGRLAEALTLSAAAAIGFYGDAETAAAKADEAHRLAVELGDAGALLDATWAHALAAHAQGELPLRLREYLRMSSALPDLATRVFDGQLCVTERMLYGGIPGQEIIAFADGLATEARRLGAARGHAFARTLRGEATVLAGRLDEADEDFTDGARLHSTIGAAAGEALSLLGRAHVAIMRGRPEHARPFLADALLLARESEVGHHTLDRIYGAMVEAAGAPDAALAVVREAETAIRGPAETCPTCRIAFLVPAAIAASRAGDLDRAARYTGEVEVALEVIALPPAWHAAGHEVRGWHARAVGDHATARGHFAQAADGFHAWEQPLDAERCAALATA